MAGKANEAPEGFVSMTPEQIQALITGAVSAAIREVAPARKLSSSEFHAKVQAIKNHQGAFRKEAMPVVPPAGYCIVSDKVGQSPKLIELYFVLHQGAQVKPFDKRMKCRTANAHTGRFYGHIVDGTLRLLAFSPYPDGTVVNKRRERVDESILYPDFGSAEVANPITNIMVNHHGTWFDKGYFEAVVRPSLKG